MRAVLLLATLAFATTSQAQWQILAAHTTADFRGVDNVGHGIVWVSGSNGTILLSTDNGAQWRHCTIPPNADHLDFRGIQAFDATTAIAMSSGPGDQSRLYKTTDGCKSWKLLLMNPDSDGFWDDLFVHKDVGVIVGDPVKGRFTVIRFSLNPNSAIFAPTATVPCDGNISSLKSLSRDCVQALNADAASTGIFAASNSSFFQIDHGFQAYGGPPPANDEDMRNHLSWIARTFFVTGGKAGAKLCEYIGFRGGDVIPPIDWQCMPVPLGSNTASSGAFSLSLRSGTNGVIVGGDYKNPTGTAGTAAWGGGLDERWTSAQTPPHGYRSSVAYDEKSKTWITVGPNGTDISTDDGRNWHPLTPTPTDTTDADKNWNALSLPFVVGPHGRIGILRPSALQPVPKHP